MRAEAGARTLTCASRRVSGRAGFKFCGRAGFCARTVFRARAGFLSSDGSSARIPARRLPRARAGFHARALSPCARAPVRAPSPVRASASVRLTACVRWLSRARWAPERLRAGSRCAPAPVPAPAARAGALTCFRGPACSLVLKKNTSALSRVWKEQNN